MPEKPRLGQVLLKAIGFTVLFLGLFFFLSVTVLSFYLYKQLDVFTTEAQTTWPELKQVINAGLTTAVTQTKNHKNILLLGIDSIEGRGDVRPLTDTMTLLSINLETGKIVSLPFPRDLWSETYQTKINALYAYGIDRYPGHPEQFPTEAITEMTNVPIHHTVVISLDQVSQLIDLLGGIKVNVETGFVDPQFPRPGVDVAIERDPEKLYMRVEFQPGEQIFTGEQALQFIRSRHSGDDEGDDVARARRQQLVMASLLQTITHPRTLTNPKIVGSLYKWYRSHFAETISVPEAIATVRMLLPVRRQIVFEGASLGIYPDDPQGALEHPPVSAQYQNQWVYSIRNPNELPKVVGIKLGL